ncbi:MAG: FkbM family methyltransferase [Candidatus Paceibacterota bacterium]
MLPIRPGGKHEKLHFFENAHSESGSIFNTHVNSKTTDVQSYEVESVTIDDIIELLKVPKIDLLKIDIEGSEYDVLNNVSPTTLGKISQLIVEFHHGTVSEFTPEDTHRVRRKLQEQGFIEFSEDGVNFLFFRPTK